MGLVDRLGFPSSNLHELRNYDDLTVTSLEWCLRNHLHMATKSSCFRSVNYCNSARLSVFPECARAFFWLLVCRRPTFYRHRHRIWFPDASKNGCLKAQEKDNKIWKIQGVDRPLLVDDADGCVVKIVKLFQTHNLIEKITKFVGPLVP